MTPHRRTLAPVPTPDPDARARDAYAAELELVGALLYASPAAATTALDHLDDTDLADPYLADIVRVIRRLAAEHQHGPVLVKDRLAGQGALSGDGRGSILRRRLVDATTSGADPLLLHALVTAVVAHAYRRRFDALHDGIEALTGQPESVWRPYLAEHFAGIVHHEQRLQALRGPGGLL